VIIAAGGRESNIVTLGIQAPSGQPVRPRLTTISKADAAPYSVLTATGDFSQSGAVYGVRFSDGGTYDVTVPASRSDNQTLTVPVPHYTLNGNLTDGNVTVSVLSSFAGQQLFFGCRTAASHSKSAGRARRTGCSDGGRSHCGAARSFRDSRCLHVFRSG
jgi:hypothetical protein